MRRPTKIYLVVTLITAVAVGGLAVLAQDYASSIASLVKTTIAPPAWLILGGDGKVLARISSKRYFEHAADYPRILKDAVIAAEDDNFYQHSGMSFTGMARATVSNIVHGRWAQGASTISQQVVKIASERRGKNFFRKVFEVIMTLALENELSKEEILHYYLSNVYLGEGAYGYPAAAQSYFGRSLEKLSTAEIALLVGLAPAPSRYDPFKQIQFAMKRRAYVLGRLFETKKISQKEFERASAEIPRFERQEKLQADAVDSVAWLVLRSIPEQQRELAFESDQTLKTALTEGDCKALKEHSEIPVNYETAKLGHFESRWDRWRVSSLVHQIIVARQASGIYEYVRAPGADDWSLDPLTPIDDEQNYVAVIDDSGLVTVGNRHFNKQIAGTRPGDVLCLRHSQSGYWVFCDAHERNWERSQGVDLVGYFRQPEAWGFADAVAEGLLADAVRLPGETVPLRLGTYDGNTVWADPRIAFIK